MRCTKAPDSVGADAKYKQAGGLGELLTFNPQRSRQIPITVVMPTLNEAAQIRDAVAALAWADEVIVVDGGSSDRTPELGIDFLPLRSCAGSFCSHTSLARRDEQSHGLPESACTVANTEIKLGSPTAARNVVRHLSQIGIRRFARADF